MQLQAKDRNSRVFMLCFVCASIAFQSIVWMASRQLSKETMEGTSEWINSLSKWKYKSEKLRQLFGFDLWPKSVLLSLSLCPFFWMLYVCRYIHWFDVCISASVGTFNHPLKLTQKKRIKYSPLWFYIHLILCLSIFSDENRMNAGSHQNTLSWMILQCLLIFIHLSRC